MAPPNGVSPFTVPQFQNLPWLWHGFSTRLGGVSRAYSVGATDLNLGFTQADAVDDVRENRRRFLNAVSGNPETPLVTVRQIHSNVTVVAGGVESGGCEADGLMTDQPGLLLGILTADCIPVLVVDPVTKAVAAFHAGWRGTVARIVERGIAQMHVHFGSRTGDLLAAIGPGIGACCYAIGGEVDERFAENFDYAAELFSRKGDQQHLDLIEANRRQLLAAGLAGDSISVAGGCTACHPELFYSHRASGGHAGRMMAAIGIRPGY
jgi:YfiH family protein